MSASNSKADAVWTPTGTYNPKTEQRAQRGQLVLKDYNTEQLFDYAATAGFVPAGSKKEVVVPAFQQMLAAAKSLIETTGNARVVLAQWISVYPALQKAMLVDGNLPDTAAIQMRCRVLKTLKVGIDDFHLVKEGDDGASIPKLDFVLSDAAGVVRGEIKKGSPINANGRNFGTVAADVKIRFAWTPDGASEPSHVDLTPSTINENLLKAAWSSAMNDIPVGAEVTVTVIRTIDGVEYTSNEKVVKVLAA